LDGSGHEKEFNHMLDHILLPLDGSVLAERVLPHAVSLTEAFDSKLTLLRVVFQDEDVNSLGIVNPIEWQMRKTEAESYLKSVQQRLQDIGVDCEAHIIEGKPAHQIVEYAKHNDVQLIVMSSHGSSGVSEWNINSTVQKVLFRALIPVMIVRAYQEPYEDLQGLTYKKLMIPLDGSKRAECILPLAESISKAQNTKIFLTHIVEEPNLPCQTPLNEEEKALIERLNEFNHNESQNYILQIKEQINQDNVETIVERSIKPTAALHNIIEKENIDLVLLSAHGFSGDNRWPYGKITLNFIAFGTTPLIIIQDLSRDEFGKTMAELYAEQSKGH
jgi:nucleotide-binding universal stress UspA family protein